MRRAKWRVVVSPDILVMKLTEECGEVAKARLDWLEADTKGAQTQAYDNLIEEIGHVEFIAGELRRAVTTCGP